MKSPTKSPTFILGFVIDVLGVILLFIGQTRGIGALLLIVGSVCMLIPIARSMLGLTPDSAPKQSSVTSPEEALHAMFSHLRTTSPPKTTSTLSAPPPKPVTPPDPRPTLQSSILKEERNTSMSIPQLDDEIYRMTDEEFVCIVTKGRLLFFNNDAPTRRIFLSEIEQAYVDRDRPGFYTQYYTCLDLRTSFRGLRIKCPNEDQAKMLVLQIRMAMMLY